jgi:hypothetical protein
VVLTKGSRLLSGQFNFAPRARVHENFSSDQSRPALVVDAVGNVVVAWNDRQPIVDQDVYWRRGRFNATGAIEWTAAEVRVNLQTEGIGLSQRRVDQDESPMWLRDNRLVWSDGCILPRVVSPTRTVTLT